MRQLDLAQENTRLRKTNTRYLIALRNVLYFARRRVPAERNKVTFYRNMAQDMRDVCLRALEGEE